MQGTKQSLQLQGKITIKTKFVKTSKILQQSS